MQEVDNEEEPLNPEDMDDHEHIPVPQTFDGKTEQERADEKSNKENQRNNVPEKEGVPAMAS